MTEDRRQQLRRRYLSLGTGEFAAVAVFVLLAATAVAPRLPGPSRTSTYASG